MLQVTKFMVERLVAGKGTTVKDIASKFKAKNADVIGMLEAVLEDGEMVIAMDTETIMAKTQLAIVKLDLGIAQEYGITDTYGKPSGYFYFKDVEEKMTQTLEMGKHTIELDADVDGAGDESAGDTAEGEGAEPQWYDPNEVKSTTTGRKTKTPEQIADELAAKAEAKAKREAAKAEREANKKAQADEKAAKREAKKAEREAAKAAHSNGDGTDCLVCHKPLTDPVNSVRGIGPVCLSRLAQSVGVEVAELMDTEKTSDARLNTYLAEYEAKGGFVKVFTTEDEAKAAHPEGIVKFSEFYKVVENAGIPPRRLMKATGGDKSAGEVLNETWLPFMIGARKYLSKDVEAKMSELTPVTE